MQAESSAGPYHAEDFLPWAGALCLHVVAVTQMTMTQLLRHLTLTLEEIWMVQSTRFILLMRQWKLGDFKLHNKLFAEGRLEPLSAVAQLTDFLDQDICPHTLTLYRMKVSVRAGEGVLLSTIKASGQRTRSPKAASSHSGCPSCLPFLPRFSRRGEQSMSADP